MCLSFGAYSDCSSGQVQQTNVFADRQECTHGYVATGNGSVSDTSDNTWISYFPSFRVKGKAYCSNTAPGANADGNICSTISRRPMADTINTNNSGSYCWCQATEYQAFSNVSHTWAAPFYKIYAKYVYLKDMGTNCQNSCATYCSYMNRDLILDGSSNIMGVNLRASIYDSLLECIPVENKITYISDGDIIDYQYYTGNSVTLKGAITKNYYLFKGWCETEDCTNPMLANSTQNGWSGAKTLYAKWERSGCETGLRTENVDGTITCTNECADGYESQFNPFTAENSSASNEGAYCSRGGNGSETDGTNWIASFSGYGYWVKGESYCSATAPLASTGDFDEACEMYLRPMQETIDTRTSGKYCWCKATEYDEVVANGTIILVSNAIPLYSKYVYTAQIDRCSAECSSFCATMSSPYPTTSHNVSSVVLRSSIYRSLKKCTPLKYTITLKDGEQTLDTIEYSVSDTVDLPTPSNTPAGYEFVGWCENLSDCDDPMIGEQTDLFGNKTLYAKWVATPLQITYEVSDGFVMPSSAPMAYMVSQPVTLLSETESDDLTYYDSPDFNPASQVTTLPNGTYQTTNATLYVAHTPKAVEPQSSYPFSVKTTSLSSGGSFKFTLSAAGTFYVDCDDGGTLSGSSGNITGNANDGWVINRPEKSDNTTYTSDEYTCTWSNSGKHTIRFGGAATDYPHRGSPFPVIGFKPSNTKVGSISGNLSDIFPMNGKIDGPMFYETFNGCVNLTEIPSTLFSSYTAGTAYMFARTFVGCSGLTEIPEDLFENIATSADHMFFATFSGCENLEEIPEDLFSGLTDGAGSLFRDTFYGCKALTTIPDGLFSTITSGAAYMYYETFRNCDHITTIPTNFKFFKADVNISGYEHMFDETFYGCESLTTLPAGLFSNIKSSGRYMFFQTFIGCTGLRTIPDGFKFINNTSSSTPGADSLFAGTFYNCTNLESIPSNLFGTITQGATYMFKRTFYNCSSLSSIPSDLFSEIMSAKQGMFQGTFEGCTNLSGYISPILFRRLITLNSPYSLDMMKNMFLNTNLDESCPNGTTQYTTDYESYWNNKVACQLGDGGHDYPFSITVKPVTGYDKFMFSISAKGTFYVDCGNGGELYGDGDAASTVSGITVTKSDTTELWYGCRFIGTNERLVRFGGLATEYSDEDAPVGFHLSGGSLIKSANGGLFPIFPSDGTISGTPTFREMFRGCNKLESISGDLFSGYTVAKSNMFELTFQSCYALQEIPENLFASFTSGADSMFLFTFQRCTALESIPENLFSFGGNTNVDGAEKMFFGTFLGCSSLTTIPANLFSHMGSGARSMYVATFKECTGLTSLPENFKFNGNNTISAQLMFGETFMGCTGLTSIPNNMFSNTTGAFGMFNKTFMNCTGLRALPKTLFANIETAARGMFVGTFAGCDGLDGNGDATKNFIPKTLFAGLIANGSPMPEMMLILPPETRANPGETLSTFANTSLPAECPEGFQPVDTAYSENWDGHVACESESGSNTETDEWPFSITTTELSGTTFSFVISAKGTFRIDCGTGGTLSGTNVSGDTSTGWTIDRSNVNTSSKSTTGDTYTCTWSSGGVKTIKFGGVASAYVWARSYPGSNDYSVERIPAISFKGRPIASMSGNLSAVFPHNASAGTNPPMFYETFMNCTSLTQIPGTLFNSITGGGQYMFYETFRGCTNLQSIPGNLFSKITGNSADYMFYRTFGGCSSLTAIPSGLFDFGNNNVPGAVNMFLQTFDGCTNLGTDSSIAEPIPANLFSHITDGAMGLFYGTFSNCSNITSIPASLFNFGGNNVNGDSSMFYGVFSGCRKIETIPSGLFSRVTTGGANMFRVAFQDCSSLKYLPDGLFASVKTPADHMFEQTFKGCNGLTTNTSMNEPSAKYNFIPANLFSVAGNGNEGIVPNPDTSPSTHEGYMMHETFKGTTLVTECPVEYLENTTGYEEYWDGHVSCKIAPNTRFNVNYTVPAPASGVSVNNQPDNTTTRGRYLYTLASAPTATGYALSGWQCQTAEEEPLAECDNGLCAASQEIIMPWTDISCVAQWDCDIDHGYAWNNDGSACVNSEEQYPFWITTTNLSANDKIAFSISAAGTFYVDCGESGTLYNGDVEISNGTINRDTGGSTYSCNYTTGGEKLIRFGGTATEYTSGGCFAFTGGGTYGASRKRIKTINGNISKIFPYYPNATYYPKFSQAFRELESIQYIPATLFADYTVGKEHMFNWAFMGCTGLGTDQNIEYPVPAGLFQNIVVNQHNTATEIFSGTFYNCSHLNKLPNGLFAGIQEGAMFMFNSTFEGCSSLTELPAGLFSGLRSSDNDIFVSTFRNCTSLTTIPSGLFNFNGRNVNGYTAMFYKTFEGCSSLTSIPEDLFSRVRGSGITMFAGTFRGCSSLTAIPANLFNFTGIKVYGDERMFQETFKGCTSLKYIPEGLFSRILHPAKEMFRGTFYGCTGLTTNPTMDDEPWAKYNFIPTNLFQLLMNRTNPSQSQYAENMMTDIFANTGLSNECPGGFEQYTTGYEQYWDGHVSCVQEEEQEHKFGITTTNLSSGDTFTFTLSASGTFVVDCGKNGTLSGYGVGADDKTINRDNRTDNDTYTCTYSSGGSKRILFNGTANGYNNQSNGDVAAISFNVSGSGSKISYIDGDLSAMFPYLGSNAGRYPTFQSTFEDCVNLASIPETLFSGYTTGAEKMFYRTFAYCNNLAQLPANLFTNITTGAERMYEGTFKDCSNLVDIPSDFKFFKANSNINGQYRMFADTFINCYDLASIPNGLFSNITTGAESMFYRTFSHCISLTQLPPRLFSSICVQDEEEAEGIFALTFQACGNLSGYIPPEIFECLIGNPSQSPNQSRLFTPSSGDTYATETGSTFEGTALADECPEDMQQYHTGYEDENGWGNCVSCEPKSGASEENIEYKFSVTTTGLSLGDSFTFTLSAAGAFYVDCAEGGELSGSGVSGTTINRTNNTNKDTYTCTYSSGGEKTILFGGIATGYNNQNDEDIDGIAAISFKSSSSKVASLSGDLSGIFPYLGSNAGRYPTFQQTFEDCINLKSIPADLFSGYTTGARNMFLGTFAGCTGLEPTSANNNTPVPALLFSRITTGATELFNGTFEDCTGLTSIPSNLFAGITNSARGLFRNTFRNTGLTSIPAGLFSGITNGNYQMFSGTFQGCTGLTSIPTNLFSSFTTGGDSMFSYTFKGCTGLTSIPNGLFKNIITGGLEMFHETFLGCNKITSIPGDLFAGITSGAPHMFVDTFNGCTKITQIPENLFANITTSAEYMFFGTFDSTGITSIPETLFANFTSGATGMFHVTFKNCTNLHELPENLFANITSVAEEMFDGTFTQCTGLTGWVPGKLFRGLIENGSPYTTNMMNGVFRSTGALATECPAGYVQYITRYEPYWDGHVSCVPVTVNLEWDPKGAENSDDVEQSAQPTCTYREENGIRLPTPPTKTGYDFKGWKVVNWGDGTN